MRERTITSISELQRGQIIRNLGSSGSYVVTSTAGERATAARTVEVSNASEWVIVEQSDDPTEIKDCIWHSGRLSSRDVRRLEAMLVARNILPFAADGFFRGFISPASANELFSESTTKWDTTRPPFKEGDGIEFGGFRLAVKQSQSGILVWGRVR